jgi:hypothetical protein
MAVVDVAGKRRAICVPLQRKHNILDRYKKRFLVFSSKRHKKVPMA